MSTNFLKGFKNIVNMQIMVVYSKGSPPYTHVNLLPLWREGWAAVQNIVHCDQNINKLHNRKGLKNLFT